MRALSDALRYLRVFNDLDQSKAASSIGISAPYLSQLESGKKTPTIDMVSKYSRFFRVPVSSILILAERLESRDFSYSGVESLVSPKILKILSWLEEKERTPEPQIDSHGKVPKKEVGRAKARAVMGRRKAQ